MRNTNEMFKHIWAGDDRIGTQRDDGGNQEIKQYFLHKDLQGSTNIVTDITGNTFQHHEYFATGEVWVDENSTVFRTPYQYEGGYVDEVRAIVNFGARWYDQNRELMYSPDPALVDDPNAIVHTPTAAGRLRVRRIEPDDERRPRRPAVHARTEAASNERPSSRPTRQRSRRTSPHDPRCRPSLAENLKTSCRESFVSLGLDIEPPPAPEAVQDDRRHR